MVMVVVMVMVMVMMMMIVMMIVMMMGDRSNVSGTSGYSNTLLTATIRYIH